MTLWGAKGLTADYVYLVGLVDEALPGKHDEESTGLNEAEWLDEQRRLLYVSLTRAKRALVMSRPTSARVGELAALGMAIPRGTRARRNLSPPRFLRELDPRLLPGAVSGDSWPGLQG